MGTKGKPRRRRAGLVEIDFETVHRRAYYAARKRGASIHDAEDKAQDAVEAVLRAKHIRDAAHAEHYGMATVRSKLIDDARRGRNDCERELPEIPARDRAFEEIEAKDVARSIMAAAKLRPEERIAVILALRDDLSREEAARQAGCTVRRYRSRRDRGFARLRAAAAIAAPDEFQDALARLAAKDFAGRLDCAELQVATELDRDADYRRWLAAMRDAAPTARRCRRSGR